MSFDEVIGRATDLLPDDYIPLEKPRKEPVPAVLSFEELLKPSSKPFKGRPDPDFPELDSLDGLYIPRYLARRYGRDKWERSAYLALWKSEFGRIGKMTAKDFGPDVKPSERKKK